MGKCVCARITLHLFNLFSPGVHISGHLLFNLFPFLKAESTWLRNSKWSSLSVFTSRWYCKSYTNIKQNMKYTGCPKKIRTTSKIWTKNNRPTEKLVTKIDRITQKVLFVYSMFLIINGSAQHVNDYSYSTIITIIITIIRIQRLLQ